MYEEVDHFKVPVGVMIFLVMIIIILTILFGTYFSKHKAVKNKVDIYQEYYELEQEFIKYRKEWILHFPEKTEVVYFLEKHEEKYMRYIELKKILRGYE